MANDTPSGEPPVDQSRWERTHNNDTGYDEINTASNNDTPGKKSQVGIAESIGKMTANVSTEGAVTAQALSSGRVRVDAGWTKMIADVELKSDVDPNPPHFRIGWVQTLMGSRRVGVYKTPKGDTISRAEDTGKLSDRREYWDGDPNKPRIEVAAPWYDLPEELGTQHRKVHIKAFDKPGFALSPTLTEDGPFKGAKLVAVQGSESFLTSLKAGDGGQVTLKTWQWAVPWDVNVEGIGTDSRTGGKATSSVSTADNPNLPGATAVTTNHSDVLEMYGSVDAAALELQHIGYSSFVQMLPKHKAAAPSSYWNMVGALWKSDAQLRVQVFKGKDAVVKDLKVGFKADGDLTANQSGSTYSMLAHMVLDPGKGMTTPIAITLNGRVVMTVPSPYNNNSANATVTMPGMLYGTNEEDMTVKFSIR